MQALETQTLEELCPFEDVEAFQRAYDDTYATIARIVANTAASEWTTADGRKIIVSRSAKQADHMQMTYFDREGLPISDASRSMRQAGEFVERLIQYGANIADYEAY